MIDRGAGFLATQDGERGVCLRIQVDEQRALVATGKADGEVDGVRDYRRAWSLPTPPFWFEIARMCMYVVMSPCEGAAMLMRGDTGILDSKPQRCDKSRGSSGRESHSPENRKLRFWGKT